MSLGLCLHCGQLGHLVRVCPKQSQRNLGTTEGCAALIDMDLRAIDPQKNKSVVVYPPGEPTA